MNTETTTKTVGSARKGTVTFTADKLGKLDTTKVAAHFAIAGRLAKDYESGAFGDRVDVNAIGKAFRAELVAIVGESVVAENLGSGSTAIAFVRCAMLGSDVVAEIAQMRKDGATKLSPSTIGISANRLCVRPEHHGVLVDAIRSGATAAAINTLQGDLLDVAPPKATDKGASTVEPNPVRDAAELMRSSSDARNNAAALLGPETVASIESAGKAGPSLDDTIRVAHNVIGRLIDLATSDDESDERTAARLALADIAEDVQAFAMVSAIG